jgi:hypothetical protein
MQVSKFISEQLPNAHDMLGNDGSQIWTIARQHFRSDFFSILLKPGRMIGCPGYSVTPARAFQNRLSDFETAALDRPRNTNI